MIASRVLSRTLSHARVARPQFSTLVATEAFNVDVAVTPKTSGPSKLTSKKLENGIKLITKDTGSGVTSVDIAIMGGSSAESPSEQGFAHLLAAGALSGSAEKSGLRLCRDLENVGATISSSVDREKIVYSISCLSDKVEEALIVVADAITKPVGSGRLYTIEESKGTANVMIKEHQADPVSQVKELLYEAAYGEATATGSPVYSNNLSKVNVEDVMAFRSRNFVSNNVVISATGISFEDMKSYVDCHFFNMPSGSKAPAGGAFSGGDMKVRVDLDGDSYLAVGFPVPAGAAALPYEVLYSKLQESLAGVPFPKYAISTFYETTSTGGVFGIVSKGSTGAAVENLTKAIGEMKSLTDGAAEGHKTKVTLANMSTLEGEGAAGALMDAVILGVDPASLADARGVKKADIVNAAKAALSASPAYAVYGATAGTPSMSSIVAMLK